MPFKTLAITIGILAGAMPATSQQRGTVAFGAFASTTSFDNGLGMNRGWGGGGRVGVFIVPRLALEFEGGGSSAGRSSGQPTVNVGVFSARLMAVPLTIGPVSLLVGTGIDHTDTYFIESYGMHGLMGAGIALSSTLVLRFDGIWSHMTNGAFDNLGLHVGLSVLRNP